MPGVGIGLFLMVRGSASSRGIALRYMPGMGGRVLMCRVPRHRILRRRPVFRGHTGHGTIA